MNYLINAHSMFYLQCFQFLVGSMRQLYHLNFRADEAEVTAQIKAFSGIALNYSVELIRLFFFKFLPW